MKNVDLINVIPEDQVYRTIFDSLGLNDESVKLCQEYAMLLVDMRIKTVLRSIKMSQVERRIYNLLINNTKDAPDNLKTTQEIHESYLIHPKGYETIEWFKENTFAGNIILKPSKN